MKFYWDVFFSKNGMCYDYYFFLCFCVSLQSFSQCLPIKCHQCLFGFIQNRCFRFKNQTKALVVSQKLYPEFFNLSKTQWKPWPLWNKTEHLHFAYYQQFSNYLAFVCGAILCKAHPWWNKFSSSKRSCFFYESLKAFVELKCLFRKIFYVNEKLYIYLWRTVWRWI